jgi:homoserine O-acetyltransferase
VRTIPCLWVALITALATWTSPASGHWPGQPPHQMAELGDLQLESGAVIPNFRMSYVTHGTLNAAKDNAILFQHGFAANHHLIDHMIGPGRPLDTDKYFIICPDALGATQTGFEHTTSPTNSGLKMKFPFYNARDMVKAQYRLITETLGIPHLLAVTGISSGGSDSIQFAVTYPQFMDGILPIVGGALGGTKLRFRRALAASIIESCKGWDGGNYDENPSQCATNALSAYVLDFYTRDWWGEYLDTPEAYSKWRNTFGDYYIDVQDTRDLYYRLVAFARGSVGDTPGFNGDLNKALSAIRAKTLFIYNPRDEGHWQSYLDAQVKAIRGAHALAIDSSGGHLICCNAEPKATRLMGDAIRAFLAELSARPKTAQ